jgi:hypothetical protein
MTPKFELKISFETIEELESFVEDQKNGFLGWQVKNNLLPMLDDLPEKDYDSVRACILKMINEYT